MCKRQTDAAAQKFSGGTNSTLQSPPLVRVRKNLCVAPLLGPRVEQLFPLEWTSHRSQRACLRYVLLLQC